MNRTTRTGLLAAGLAFGMVGFVAKGVIQWLIGAH